MSTYWLSGGAIVPKAESSELAAGTVHAIPSISVLCEMSGIEAADGTGRVVGTRYLVIRRNRLGFGLDVGWGVHDRDGVYCHIWWGNTRDTASLALLIEDCRQHGKEFQPPTAAEIANLTT